jgi:hypothetical protein
LGLVQECFLRCLHLERLENGRLATQMRIIIETIGEPTQPIDNHVPVFMSPIHGIAPVTPTSATTGGASAGVTPATSNANSPTAAAATSAAATSAAATSAAPSQSGLAAQSAAAVCVVDPRNLLSLGSGLGSGLESIERESPGHVGEWTRALMGNSSTDLLGDSLPSNVKQELGWEVFGEEGIDDTSEGGEGFAAPTAAENVTTNGNGAVDEATDEATDDALGESTLDVDWLDSLLDWTVQQPVNN